jgi:tetratricopeptide (TPR) repeat protein
VLDETNPQALVAISTNLGVARSEQERYAEALSHFTTALRTYRTQDDIAAAARTLNNIGVVYRRMGEHLRAIECHRESRPALRLAKPAVELRWKTGLLAARRPSCRSCGDGDGTPAQRLPSPVDRQRR